MTEPIRRFPEPVSDARGEFSCMVMARDRGDGSWEGWLEYVAVGADVAAGCVTGIETRQRDRVALERWASGLTHVYVEGAFARASGSGRETPGSVLVAALIEIVEVLDRRIPEVERAHEFRIAADTKRLRAEAVRRITSLRHAAR
jgi:hypothetical protein